jgi:signal transduction histidine kinase
MRSEEPEPARHRDGEGPDPELAKVDFDALLREILTRVEGVLDEQTRLKLLLDAVVTLAADLTVDGVLTRIVAIAGELVDAQYAALGVLSSGRGDRLRTFVHHGMNPDQVAEIGDLPRGHGLLGLIIDRPEPLRLHDIAEHPASYGFPDHHPPMQSFLGVPVRIGNRVFGNLYLTEKAGGGDFTAQDEAIVVALAAAAGVAIENAQLYAESARRQEWLAASAEITALLSAGDPGAEALQMIADRAREVAGADVAWIVTGLERESLVLTAVSGAEADRDKMNSVPLDHSLAGVVVETRAAVAVDDLAADPRALDVATWLGWPRLGPAVVVPLGSGANVEGALALAWEPENAEDYYSLDASLPANFAEHAALALQINRAREDRQQLVVLEDRDRIGRDLHDVVIQRLFAVGLGLQATARTVDRADVTQRLDQAVDDLDATIKDIRRAIFALAATQGSHDIQVEVSRLVDRAAGTLKFRPTLLFEGPVRTLVDGDLAPDLLAVLGEALSNASRHSGARAVDVVLTAGEEVVLSVADDGRGLEEGAHESGLRNMRERARRRGGSLTLTSAPGQGTTVIWSVPVVASP